MKKLKICIMSKYPPYMGGIAGLNYWFARTLGELGHEVHFVTDPPHERGNYLKNLSAEQMQDYEPKNVRVYKTESDYHSLMRSRASVLVNSAINVIEKNDIDLIDTKYFIPYGAAGLLTKLITKKPLVVRHGGSDITYLLKDPSYRTLIIKILKNSDKIILDPSKLEDVKNIGVEEKRISCCSDFGMNIPDVPIEKTKSFLKNIGIEDGSPIIGCFGKIFRRKGVVELLRSLSKIKNEDFSILLLPQKNEDEIKSYVSKFGLEDKSFILDYQPPWLMPILYDSLTALIATEVDFRVKMHTPLTAYESLHFGKCTVISEETHRKPQFRNFNDGVDIIVVDPKDTGNYANKLKWIIKNPEEAEKIGRNAKSSNKCPDGKIIIEKLVEIYREVIESG